MKNALNNQVGMLGDMFLWLVANLKQGVIYFIKQALPPNISAGSVAEVRIFNVTLLVEMKDKEFTSHKAKYALQFGTNNNMIGLSLTFKSIKQKIQFSQHSELISFLMF